MCVNDELIERANNDDLDAIIELIYYYDDAEKYDEEWFWIKKGFNIDKDNRDILFFMARCYRNGFGTKIAFEKAIELSKKACDLGCGDASFMLAIMYEEGEGVEKSFDKAKQYYEKSINQGYMYSAYRLGEAYDIGGFLETDFKKAGKYYQLAIDNEVSYGEFRYGYDGLGDLYLFGHLFDEKMTNEEKAAEIYIRGIKKGDPICKEKMEFFNLGTGFSGIFLKSKLIKAGYSMEEAEIEVKKHIKRVNEHNKLIMERRRLYSCLQALLKEKSRTNNTTKYQVVNKVNACEKKGCYIATAVYGTYDCPQLWVLRRFRDTFLENRWWGRMFIMAYYKVSPVIVRILGDNKKINDSIRKLLDYFVKILKNKGFGEQPYQD